MIHVPESSCLQFRAAFLTPKCSSLQTQLASDFLLHTLGPLTHTPAEFRVERGGSLQGRSCVRRACCVSTSFALG